MLRLVTYLVPTQLYDHVADDLTSQLGVPVTLQVDHTASGPLPYSANPFSDGSCDIGFICGESYLRHPDNVKLLGVAPVYDDARNEGRPVYFSELMVRRNAAYAKGTPLHGARLVYNDPASLSGWTSVLDHLARHGMTTDIFRSITASGSHAASIQMIADHHADVAAIDATVLRVTDERLRRRLTSIETLGPYPAQPAVARGDLAADLCERIRLSLLTMHERCADSLKRCGVLRFAAVDESAYSAVAERFNAARASWRD